MRVSQNTHAGSAKDTDTFNNPHFVYHKTRMCGFPKHACGSTKKPYAGFLDNNTGFAMLPFWTFLRVLKFHDVGF